MKILIPFILLLLTFTVKAQEAIPELITDRPDQTESSTLVPFKSLQIETGFVMENDKSDFSKKTSFAYNTTLLRYGLFKNMELRLGLEYLGEKIEIKNPNTLNSYRGLSPLYIGFKTKIAEENGWMPEIAFLGAMILPFTADKAFKPSHPAADMRFSFAHTLSDRFSLGYNIGAEWDGESANPSYFYSISLGIKIIDKLGMFIESYGLLHKGSNNEHIADMGFTYLILPNLQLDISGGIGLNDEAIDNFISAGLSIRLPH